MSDTLYNDTLADKVELTGGRSLGQSLRTRWRRVETRLSDQLSPESYINLDKVHLFEVGLDSRRLTEFDWTGVDAGDPEPAQRAANLNRRNTEASKGGPRAYRVQQILIDDSVFQEAAAAIAPGDPSPPDSFELSALFDPGLKALAEALLDEACNPTVGGDLYADTLAQQIAIRILRSRYEPSTSAQSNRKELSTNDLNRLSAYLDADLTVKGGVDELAAVLDMEPFAFSRAFKETTGQTPHQHLIERRVHRVKDLLLEDRLGLAEIAYETGFSSQSHMTSTFKKRVGAAPGKWRKTVLRGSLETG